MSTRREALVPVEKSIKGTPEDLGSDAQSAGVGHLIKLTGNAAAVFLTEGTETTSLTSCLWCFHLSVLICSGGSVLSQALFDAGQDMQARDGCRKQSPHYQVEKMETADGFSEKICLEKQLHFWSEKDSEG